MLIAAIAVIIFSMVGIAAMTGLLPSAMSGYRVPEAPPSPAKRVPRDAPRVLDAPHAARDAASGAANACTTCGVVESVRALEHKTTVAGADGDADRRVETRITYQVRVRMEDGSHRSHYQGTAPKLTVGQHVRLADGRVFTD